MGKWFGRTSRVEASREERLILRETGADVSKVLERQRQDAVEAAARVARSCRDVRRVHVVLKERPDYREISRYRRVAEDNGLDMAIDGAGTVSLRSRDATVESRTADQVRRSGGVET